MPQECDAATPATKETEVPATSATSTWVRSTWTLPSPPVRSEEDPDHPWTAEWYESTEPVSPRPGEFIIFGVEEDMSFGEFTTNNGVINFVNDSGFLEKLYPANHCLWKPCLTADMCKRNGILDYVLKGSWETYCQDRGIRPQTSKREWDAYKAKVPAVGLKPRKKDLLIERAITHRESDVLASHACNAAVCRIASCLYWYEEDGRTFENFCTRREISLEQGRALVAYFKDRGVLATLHHLSVKGHLAEFLLPSLPRPKARKPRKPRKPRTKVRRVAEVKTFRTQAAFRKHVEKHAKDAEVFSDTLVLKLRTDKGNIYHFRSLRTHLATMCSDLVCEGKAPRLKALGRFTVANSILWSIKQALPCEEEMSYFSNMTKKMREVLYYASEKAMKPYTWYFCVYDYISYVFIEAAFKFEKSEEGSLCGCIITVKYRVVPEKVKVVAEGEQIFIFVYKVSNW